MIILVFLGKLPIAENRGIYSVAEEREILVLILWLQYRPFKRDKYYVVNNIL